MISLTIMLTFARIRPVKLVWSTLLLTLLVSTFDITRLRLPTLLYLFFLIQPGIIILFWTRCSMHTVLLPAAKFVYGASLDLDDCSVSPLLLVQELLGNITYLFSHVCVFFSLFMLLRYRPQCLVCSGLFLKFNTDCPHVCSQNWAICHFPLLLIWTLSCKL